MRRRIAIVASIAAMAACSSPAALERKSDTKGPTCNVVLSADRPAPFGWAYDGPAKVWRKADRTIGFSVSEDSTIYDREICIELEGATK
jgi:ABC-type amino acid transport substrate-binding protein